ncbi:Pantoate-beta-alanine ligase/ pantothenate synthase [gamma proteobacterium HdN1]|nr:Pantoate-beta-alanine ligase/ pantothenate synthase [gamma proteobacterium HdN1]
MQTVNTIAAVRERIQSETRQGKRIGFVPTMGNLHEGHAHLVREARKYCDFVVASVFVNPTQFGAGEDFDSYPRTLEADQARLQEAGCDLLFAPNVAEMYPNQNNDWVKVLVSDITTRHCGASRPGHFDGVGLVVSKLFNIVRPHVALFGKKDFQQLAVIRRMVEALCFDIEIIGVDTVREASGLAMSSRNGYLTPQERTQAVLLYQTLCKARDAILDGNTDFNGITEQANSALRDGGFIPDYFTVCRADNLQPAMPVDRSLVILAAARLGKARLIDNIDFVCR